VPTLYPRCTYTVPKLGLRCDYAKTMLRRRYTHPKAPRGLHCDYAKTMLRRRYTHPKAPRGLRWGDGGMESSAACLFAKAGQVQRKGGRVAEAGEGIPKMRGGSVNDKRKKEAREQAERRTDRHVDKTLPYPGPSQSTGRLCVVSDGRSYLFACRTWDIESAILYLYSLGFFPFFPPCFPPSVPLSSSPILSLCHSPSTYPPCVYPPFVSPSLPVPLRPSAPSPSPGSPSQRWNWTRRPR